MASVKSNYIFNTANQLINMAVQIVAVPYVTRILGADNIGIYAYTYSVATYFVMFTVLGLNNYGNREIAKVKNDKEELNKAFTSIYLMQLICGIAMVILYSAFVFLFASSYKSIFWLQLIYVISGAVDINWAMYGLEEFRFTSIRNSIISLLNFACIILFVKTEESLMLYTLIMGLGVMANQLVGWQYIRKEIQITRIRIDDIVKHIKPNLILFIPIIAVSLYKIMDKIMLGYISSMNHVGYYESSEKIIRIPTVLISSLGTVMLPRMSMLYSSNKNEKSKDYMRKSIDLAMILSSSLSFGIMAVSREFVPLYYGKGFEECVYIYIALLPSCVFLAFSNVIRTQYLIPKGKDKIFIKGVFTGAIVNLILNILLIPNFNSLGAAVATFVAEFSVCASQAFDVRKEIDIKSYVVRGTPFVLVGILMFLSLFFIDITSIHIVSIVIKMVIGAIIYLAGVFVIVTKKKNIYDYDLRKIVHKYIKGK